MSFRLRRFISYLSLLPVILFITAASFPEKKEISLKTEFTKNLVVLCNDLLKLQNMDKADPNYGALYCASCGDYHTRASESVLPFAIAYAQTGDEKFLTAAVSTGDWLIAQQKEDGSWFETPSEWTGTTTDQLLMLSSAYPVLQDKLSDTQKIKWKNSIGAAATWLVKNMNHVFASINYCATTTATLMTSFRVVPDSSFVWKADELAELVTSKFDEDYFLTGEGNRIGNTKYGIDLGYNMDMSVWGLGLYAKLRGNQKVWKYASESLKRMLYFIYPDGSTDNSWGVRSSKWTTFGSFTADGSQILFSLFAADNPAYRTAAVANMNYFMSLKKDGLITYGPGYYEIFKSRPCIYPTFCRAKNLSMAILYGEQNPGPGTELPTQKISWGKYFKTLDVALVRTENFMTTVTAYRYKDIRRGADFKYMHRPSGGTITNLWVKDYGYLQASGQTEYHRWEMNYPDLKDSLSIAPRIEFTDTAAKGPGNYYTSLFEFDAHLELSESNGVFKTEAIGELKNRDRWEAGVAYTLTHEIYDDHIDKTVKLRFHGRRSEVNIIEPFVRNADTEFKIIDDQTISISGGKRKFIVKLISKDCKIEFGGDSEKYQQPFPALNAFPLVIHVNAPDNGFLREVKYRIQLL